ncbi:Protein ULTRAPETALA 2 [Linum perenne]
MEGFSRGGPDHVEVKCGCTSKKYGDCIGVLTVYSNGQFLIQCQCNSCYQDPFKVYTPYEFEKHGRGEGNSKWKSHLWVMKNGKKLAIWRTELYKYYRHSANGGSGCMRRQFHRDEFMSCTLCGKQRRFRQRNKQQCRNYHDALLSQPTWKCADIRGSSRKRCRDAEERDSRKKFRGCPRTGSCKGCTTCVCLGCLTCRFVDCNCRTCLDFMQNADP